MQYEESSRHSSHSYRGNGDPKACIWMIVLAAFAAEQNEKGSVRPDQDASDQESVTHDEPPNSSHPVDFMEFRRPLA